MASNQKTTQQKTPKTNCFLSCFGFSSKTKSFKNKPKKNGARKFFKFCWPKLKVLTIERKKFIFEVKTAALKASHNIILEATKSQQLKQIDHHVVSKTIQPNVPSKGSTHQDDENRPTNQSYCATCHNDQHPATLKVVKRPTFGNKSTNDSLIGISIMLSSLIILLIWGRLCAILCMCGWLYCTPLLRGDRVVVVTPKNQMNTKLSMQDYNSEMHKKKVVLQGFLQRDHKSAIAIS
ncbi:uncharacterized protein At5g23160 [Beta vulgaris subsp. vulgaris]|uniref:uncharacterized protein At5g23160 n=1 Tax=Beta vulgaris subsp. vulgaris TaxID=3555 RepID=UPI002036BAF2|nr:uncharacterized protein At5g23160 [Beta vulgaris subsp. vulgaris]